MFNFFNKKKEDNIVWTTESVNEVLKEINEGGIPKRIPFNHITEKGWRAPGVKFSMTEEEQQIFDECAKNPVYFAENFPYSMTDLGICKLELRDYQREIIRIYDSNKYVVMTTGRQSGKCVTGDTRIAIRKDGIRREIKFISLFSKTRIIDYMIEITYSIIARLLPYAK